MDIGISTFIAALLITAKSGSNPKCPSTDEWVKNNVVDIFNVYYQPYKVRKFCTYNNRDEP